MFGGVAGLRVLDVSKRRFTIFFTVEQPEKTLPPKMTVLRHFETSEILNPTRKRNVTEDRFSAKHIHRQL
jgi:hypothetical protein